MKKILMVLLLIASLAIGLWANIAAQPQTAQAISDFNLQVSQMTWAANDTSGIVFDTDDVKITAQTLNFDFGKELAEVRTEYTLDNTSDQPIDLQMMMLAPTEGGYDYAVTNGDTAVVNSQICLYMPKNQMVFSSWRGALAAIEQKPTPFGDGSGFVKYTLTEDAAEGDAISFAPTAHYYIGGAVVQTFEGTVTASDWQKDAIIVTKEALDLQGAPHTAEAIEDMYAFMFDLGVAQQGASVHSLAAGQTAEQTAKIREYRYNIYLFRAEGAWQLTIPDLSTDGVFATAVVFSTTLAAGENKLTICYQAHLNVDLYRTTALNYLPSPKGQWAEGAKLDIRLALCKSYPKLASSSIDLVGGSKRTYSATVDDIAQTISIEARTTAMQSFFGTFRNPVVIWTLFVYVYPICMAVILSVILVLRLVRRYGKKGKQKTTVQPPKAEDGQ